MTRLYRCAPEHIRKLSSDEERSISDLDRSMFQLPERSGNGVFQFRELSQQHMPPENNPMSHQNIPLSNSTINPMSNEPEVIVPTQPPNNAQDQYPSNNSQIGPEIQPDAEPAVSPTVSEMLQMPSTLQYHLLPPKRMTSSWMRRLLISGKSGGISSFVIM